MRPWKLAGVASHSGSGVTVLLPDRYMQIEKSRLCRMCKPVRQRHSVEATLTSAEINAAQARNYDVVTASLVVFANLYRTLHCPCVRLKNVQPFKSLSLTSRLGKRRPTTRMSRSGLSS